MRAAACTDYAGCVETHHGTALKKTLKQVQSHITHDGDTRHASSNNGADNCVFDRRGAVLGLYETPYAVPLRLHLESSI